MNLAEVKIGDHPNLQTLVTSAEIVEAQAIAQEKNKLFDHNKAPAG